MNLTPGTAILARSHGALLVGADPTRRLLLHSPTPDERQWLLEAARAAQPADLGRIPPPAPAPTPALEPLRLRLHQAGLLASEDARPALRLLLDGVDPTSLGVLPLLREVCDLHVHLADHAPADRSLQEFLGVPCLGQARGRAASACLAPRMPDVTWGRMSHADIVLVTRERIVDQVRTGALVEQEVPHLLLTHDEASTVIGPLVVPGHTPCAHCWELSITEAEPRHPLDRLELEEWRVARPGPARRQVAALEAARALLAITGAHRLGGRAPTTWGGLLVRVGEDGEARSSRIVAHARCRCGALGTPFPVRREKARRTGVGAREPLSRGAQGGAGAQVFEKVRSAVLVGG
ncbi:hypothetical protein I6B53_03560 [Schaalia sp. 19OD2882]|uniref:hypothetical protein n=1 Tax=Schaalia sp. 19OD2882 TaxID=2794089 RepID=UPI001C1F1F47|nr:hypothetical protein [Schaalia sp. 19OD2882]QWW20186.1 hypothetical protein I6B53_03560 [Schaalia sp. 19OD2882]